MDEGVPSDRENPRDKCWLRISDTLFGSPLVGPLMWSTYVLSGMSL